MVQGIFALETTGLLVWLMILVLWGLCHWVVVAEENVTQDGRTWGVWAVDTHLFRTIAPGGGTTVEEEGEEVKRVDVARVGLLEVVRLLLGTCMIEGGLMGLSSVYCTEI